MSFWLLLKAITGVPGYWACSPSKLRDFDNVSIIFYVLKCEGTFIFWGMGDVIYV